MTETPGVGITDTGEVRALALQLGGRECGSVKQAPTVANWAPDSLLEAQGWQGTAFYRRDGDGGREHCCTLLRDVWLYCMDGDSEARVVAHT